MSAPTATRTDPVVAAFVAGDAAGVASLCRDDVILDVNIPAWRFQLQGREALQSLLESEEFFPGRVVDDWRAVDTADGVLLEVQTRAPLHGDEHLWRQLVWYRRAGDAVAEVVVYCSGHWDSATVARQAAEAPMVRR